MTATTCPWCRKPLDDDRRLDHHFAQRHPTVAALDGFPPVVCTGCTAEFDSFSAGQIAELVADHAAGADFEEFVRLYVTAARKAHGTTPTQRAHSALAEYLALCEQHGAVPCDCGQCPTDRFSTSCEQAALQDYEQHFQPPKADVTP